MRHLLLISVLGWSLVGLTGCNGGRAVKPPEGAADTSTNPGAVGINLGSEKVKDVPPPATK